MGYNDIGYNNKHVQTPIMDELAKNGITLQQNYVQTMCTPSRISFLSVIVEKLVPKFFMYSGTCFIAKLGAEKGHFQHFRSIYKI